MISSSTILYCSHENLIFEVVHYILNVNNFYLKDYEVFHVYHFLLKYHLHHLLKFYHLNNINIFHIVEITDYLT